MASTPKSKSRHPGAKKSVQVSPNSATLGSWFGQSPPNRDPGPTQLEVDKRGSLSQEFQKLQNELEIFIQKVEELANTGKSQKLCFCIEPLSASHNDRFFSEFIIGIQTVKVQEEPLDPEEQQKRETRRQKQAAHSARIVYVLQQKVFICQKHLNWSDVKNVDPACFLILKKDDRSTGRSKKIPKSESMGHQKGTFFF